MKAPPPPQRNEYATLAQFHAAMETWRVEHYEKAVAGFGSEIEALIGIDTSDWPHKTWRQLAAENPGVPYIEQEAQQEQRHLNLKGAAQRFLIDLVKPAK